MPVDPMNKEQKDPDVINLGAPRLAWYKQKVWKIRCIGSIYSLLSEKDWSSIKHDRKSNHLLRHTPSLLYIESCCDGIWRSHLREFLRHLDHHRRFPSKIIGWKNWIQKLLEVVKDSQHTQPKTKNPIIKNGASTQTRTERPVGGQESTKVEKLDMTSEYQDCHIAVMKEAEHFRVQELVKKIESHPYREALQADLQQNNVYNPFSNNSKAMIRELCNVTLFELCETTPKVQCSQCLLYWNQRIVYCTCGHILVVSESRRKIHKLRLDALCIQNSAIKKGHSHGGRQGQNPKELKEYHRAWNAWKRCCKKVDSQGGHFPGIHDRFPQRSSLSWITTRIRMDRTKVQRVGRTCKRRPYISSHSRGI